MGTVTAAPWKQLLLNALESNAHLKHSSFYQLATIGTNGGPSNRTVVFRGFSYLGEQSSEESLQDSTTPVSSFCLMVLAPDQVDYLNLKKNERLVFKSGPSANC